MRHEHAILSGWLAFGVIAGLIAQQPGSAAQIRGGRQMTDPRSAGGGTCSDNAFNCIDTPNPLTAPDTVWMEEMTWMDLRDAFNAGKTTVIISTGGIEPNGPFLALGKHNFVLRSNCDAIARKLGNALCAPIVPFVPEGDIEPPTDHMRTIGTISLGESTFRALLTDIVHSYKMHGFENIILIGDSSGNQQGMRAVADRLNAQWNGKPFVGYIPEYYAYSSVATLLKQLGVTQEGRTDNLHDDPGITLNIFMTDPKMVRWEQRVEAHLATIDGVSLADRDRDLELGRKIVEMRATNTVAAIKKAVTEHARGRSTQS